MNKKIEEFKKFTRNLPGYYDYKNMPHEFRPYIMFSNAENYNTKFISTDKFGFRKTVNQQGKKIKLNELKRNHSDCNVIVGGSTTFGMGCSSDQNTISSHLSAQGVFCQNFGIRAATSQQELIVFLQFKKYLGKIKNILILSGANDISVAAQNSSFFYPDFGFLFAEEIRFNEFWQQYVGFNERKWEFGKNNFFNLIEILTRKFKIFKFFFSTLCSWWSSSKLVNRTKQRQKLNFEEKIKVVNKFLSNDFDTWAAISKHINANPIYILQPCINWHTKKLSKNEQYVMECQREHLGSEYYDKLVSKKIYLEQKKFIKELCALNNISFYDANEWISKLDEKDEVFIDSHHLTDFGNQYLANCIQKII